MITGLMGRVRERMRRKPRPMESYGSPAVEIYGGRVYSGERSSYLRSHAARWEEYLTMIHNTPIIAAGMRYFSDLLAGAAWQFVAADRDGNNEFANRLEGMMTEGMATEWPHVIARIGLARFFGFSVQEWIMGRTDEGAYTMADIEIRPGQSLPEWEVLLGPVAKMPKTGRVLGVYQESTTFQRVFLPRSKLVYFVDDLYSGSPTGTGLLRQMVEAARRLERYEQLEGWGFELDLRGVPIVRLPRMEMRERVQKGMLKKEQVDAVEEELKDFQRNHIRGPELGLLLDSQTYRGTDDAGVVSNQRMWDLELLTGDAVSYTENAAAIERLNREMARIMGVEQMMLGDKGGSWALAKDKTHAFTLQVNAVLQSIKQVVDRDLVDKIWQWNGWPDDVRPRVVVSTVQDENVVEKAQVLRDLAVAGRPVGLDDPAYDEFRDLMGLSRPTADAMYMPVDAVEESMDNAD